MRVQWPAHVMPVMVTATLTRIVTKDCSVFSVIGVIQRKYLAALSVELGISQEQITATEVMVLRLRHLRPRQLSYHLWNGVGQEGALLRRLAQFV